MAIGLIVDTSFLISLADDTRTNHAHALAYWEYFRKKGEPIYLSTVVVSEYEVGHHLSEKVISACVPIEFGWADAMRAAEFESYREKEEGIQRQAVKDDIKIIAQAVGKNVAFAITDDHNTFAKYSEKLRQAKRVNFKTLALRDGFSTAHFEIQTFSGPIVIQEILEMP
jgi:hypothetical protein